MDALLLACRGLASGRVQKAGGRNMQQEKQRKALFFCHLFGQDLDKLPLELVRLCIKTSKQHDSTGSSTQ